MHTKEDLVYYSTCKQLPLKIFFEIAENGDVELLLTKDEKKDKAVLVEAWERIIKEYAKLDGNNSILDIIEKNDEIFNKAALYCEIRAMLLYLLGSEKQEYVDRLNELGYTINLTSNVEKLKSIQLNDTRANHISTKMQFLQKDIEKYQSGKRQTFDGAMAYISSSLGFEPREDITVSRFVEYRKQITARQKAKAKK